MKLCLRYVIDFNGKHAIYVLLFERHTERK